MERRQRRRSEPRRELAAIRVQGGLSQAKLAEAIGASLNAVRGWEQGWSAPMPRFRKPLAEALCVSLIEIDRLIDGRPPDVDSHTVGFDLTLYESLVQTAGTLSQVEAVAVPGLLQTRAYALAIEPFAYSPRSQDRITQRVEQRTVRQQALHRAEHPLTFHALVAEQVLTCVIGSRAVMADQCAHLLDLAALQNIDLRLLPSDGRHTPARGGFQLLTKPGATGPFLVVEFGAAGPSYEERPDLVALYDGFYDHLRSVALTPSDTHRRIQQIQETHR